MKSLSDWMMWNWTIRRQQPLQCGRARLAQQSLGVGLQPYLTARLQAIEQLVDERLQPTCPDVARRFPDDSSGIGYIWPVPPRPSPSQASTPTPPAAQ